MDCIGDASCIDCRMLAMVVGSSRWRGPRTRASSRTCRSWTRGAWSRASSRTCRPSKVAMDKRPAVSYMFKMDKRFHVTSSSLIRNKTAIGGAKEKHL